MAIFRKSPVDTIVDRISVEQENLPQGGAIDLSAEQELAERVAEANAVFESQMAVVNDAGAPPISKMGVTVIVSFPTARLLSPSLAPLSHFAYEEMQRELAGMFVRGEIYAFVTRLAHEFRDMLTENGPAKGTEGEGEEMIGDVPDSIEGYFNPEAEE